MSTVNRIMLLLKDHAPLTVAQLAEEIGLNEKSIACAIWRARKGGMKIRVCGALKTQNRPFLYEISNKEDVEICKKGCGGKPVHRGRPLAEDPEDYMNARTSAPWIKPFRHWQDVAFFGSPA